MNETTVADYLMNPAEDVILFGAELQEGMWVLAEEPVCRPGAEASEDRQLRGQRFRKVMRLSRDGDVLRFVGEWVDGYQEVHRYNVCHAWLVKKDSIPEDAS